jgi:hypothetical protein
MRIHIPKVALLVLWSVGPDGILAWSLTSSSPSFAASNAVRTPAASVPQPPAAFVSRRQAWKQAASAAAAASVALVVPVRPVAAYPDEETARVTTRMGGLLDAFQDGGRGLRLMAPSGWNKFDGEVGAYDLKWQDLVDPSENIKVSSTPVKSATESVQGTYGLCRVFFRRSVSCPVQRLRRFVVKGQALDAHFACLALSHTVGLCHQCWAR